MKKILSLALAMIMVLSLTMALTACSDKKEAGANNGAAAVTESDGTVTAEQYEAGVKFVKENTATYADVAKAFGKDGAKTLDDNWSESYHYYTWTDGTRSVIVTFIVDGGVESNYSYTGDIDV